VPQAVAVHQVVDYLAGSVGGESFAVGQSVTHVGRQAAKERGARIPSGYLLPTVLPASRRSPQLGALTILRRT
jgi:hypothetical protein